MYNIEELSLLLLSELKEIAKSLKVNSYDQLSKQELIYKILDQQAIIPEAALREKKITLPKDTSKQMHTQSSTSKSPRVKREGNMSSTVAIGWTFTWLSWPLL